MKSHHREYRPGDEFVARWAHAGAYTGRGRHRAQTAAVDRPAIRTRYQPFRFGGHIGLGKGAGSYPMFDTVRDCLAWLAVNPDFRCAGIYDWHRGRYVPGDLVMIAALRVDAYDRADGIVT